MTSAARMLAASRQWACNNQRTAGRTLLRAADAVPEYLSIMAVGAAGSGKSETCNTILGEAHFTTSSGMAPQSAGTENDVLKKGKTKYRVFDTAGFLEPDLKPAEFDEMMTPVAVTSETGVDAFLLTFPCGRWGLENNASLRLFKSNFGAKAFNNVVVVFTRCGTMTDSKLTDEMRRVVPNVLADLGTVEGRDGKSRIPVVAMGELTQERKKADQARLLETVQAVAVRNGGRGYDAAPAFAKVRARRGRQQDRIEVLTPEVRTVFLQMLERERKTGLVGEKDLESKLMEAEAIETVADDAERSEEQQRLCREMNRLVLQGSASFAAAGLRKFIGRAFGGFMSSMSRLPTDYPGSR